MTERWAASMADEPLSDSHRAAIRALGLDPDALPLAPWEFSDTLTPGQSSNEQAGANDG